MNKQDQKEKIEEYEVPLDDSLNVGGEPFFSVDMVTVPTKYKVVDGKAKVTTWGTRIDYIIESEQGYRYVLSSWNMNMPKVKATALIGKTIELKPFNEKKVLVTIQ